jgi:hypothetical protein
MMLAQLEPVAAEHLKDWMLVFAGLVAIVYYVKEILGGKKRREVSFEFEPVSKDEFDRHVRETKAHCDTLHGGILEARHQTEAHASARNKTIFDKIESIRKELDIKLEDTRRELSAKIDEMPDRVISTLRNTGAI